MNPQPGETIEDMMARQSRGQFTPQEIMELQQAQPDAQTAPQPPPAGPPQAPPSSGAPAGGPPQGMAPQTPIGGPQPNPMQVQQMQAAALRQ